MKGGITSGVIYPLAICRLAEAYSLRNIGGASAGAIAAAAAAAAEYGRDRGGSLDGAGFEGLEQLADKLGVEVGPNKSPRLLTLFQPTPAAKPVFDILLTVLGPQGPVRKAAAVLGVVLSQKPTFALLSVVAVAAMGFVSATGVTGWGTWLGLGLGALALLAVGLAASVAQFAWESLAALGPAVGYGICPGYSETASDPPLTPWLGQVFNDLAGMAGPAPMTFGDLAAKKINLSVMTTNLTRGRPYRIPFAAPDTATYFFKRSDFETLFSKEIVTFMIAGAEARLAATDKETEKLRLIFQQVNAGPEKDFFPFPAGDALPVVVAVRMSLSFPVLLQAVPLYAVDWTLKSNQEGQPKLERCWFSDGGICSNLPIHFFDSLLPGRPTFALDLKSPHPDHPVRLPPFKPGESERDNVWLPTANAAGATGTWTRFDQQPGKIPLFSFLGTMVDTMQSWNDNLTALYPGYRDRIVHISHTDAEGGLNLNMSKEQIDRLANRGAAAGEVLRGRFDPATGTGWVNHLWVRYRTLLAMLGDQSESIAVTLEGDTTHKLEQLFDAPPSYRFVNNAQRETAARANALLIQLAHELGAAVPPMSDGAPNPRADLKGRPRSG